MSKALASIDLNSLMVGAESNRYITTIDGTGIKIADKKSVNQNYVKIDSTGMEIYSGTTTATKVAELKSYITLGSRASSSTTGTGSIAIGTSVIASGIHSYAEGYHTTASGNYSHAEGWYTIASGAYSHAEGRSGQNEGEDLIASGIGSHAEGDCTRATGIASHAGGQYSQANGNYSFTHGSNTIASSAFQAVFGKYNEEVSDAMFIIGNGTDNSNRSNLMTVGNNSIIIGKSSAAHTTLDANGQRFYAADGTTQLANIGYGEGTAQSGTATAPYYTFGTRGHNWIGNYSVSEGNSTDASSFASHSEGYQTLADSNYAHAEGYGTTSSGQASHAEGRDTTASDLYAHAEGFSTTASGKQSHAEGDSTTASGENSHAQNLGTTAAYDNQTVIGKYNDNKSGNIFEIGYGTSGTPTNVFEVDTSGNVEAAGDITDGGGNVLSDKLDASALADYVTEQASSGNWRYRKWHSGRVEAWFNDSITMSATTAQGNLYRRSATLAIPSGIFTISPGVIVGSQTSDNTIVSVKGSASSATSIAITDYRTNQLASTQSRAIRVYAWQNPTS